MTGGPRHVLGQVLQTARGFSNRQSYCGYLVFAFHQPEPEATVCIASHTLHARAAV